MKLLSQKRHTIPLRTGRTQWCLSSPKRSAARRGVARIEEHILPCDGDAATATQAKAGASSCAKYEPAPSQGGYPYRVPPINRHSVIGLAGGWAHRRKCEKRETAAIAHTSLHAQSATRVTAADPIDCLRIAASPAWRSSAQVRASAQPDGLAQYSVKRSQTLQRTTKRCATKLRRARFANAHGAI
jgi:hypothetical protein